ncbi:MAG: four helix bundle protein [Candidatus Magasanikbacteria bacterium]|nr:four helix bundle protein [Candidatus Magasanikbacteria bacterium]
MANIAEAHGRYFFKDKIRVMYIVRGEIEETQSHLWVAYSQKYIDKDTWLDIEKRYDKLYC